MPTPAWRTCGCTSTPRASSTGVAPGNPDCLCDAVGLRPSGAQPHGVADSHRVGSVFDEVVHPVRKPSALQFAIHQRARRTGEKPAEGLQEHGRMAAD